VRKFLPLLGGVLLSLGLLTLAAAWPNEPVPTGSRAEVLEALVNESLQIADEDDPLRRADGSARVADALAAAVARASARNDRASALALTKHLGLVLERGVNGNIYKLDPNGIEAARYDEWVELTQRPDAIHNALDKPLQHLDRPAADEIDKILTGTVKGWAKGLKGEKGKEMAKEKGKGKGKKKDDWDDEDGPRGKDKKAKDDKKDDKKAKGKDDKKGKGKDDPKKRKDDDDRRQTSVDTLPVARVVDAGGAYLPTRSRSILNPAWSRSAARSGSVVSSRARSASRKRSSFSARSRKRTASPA
jgi:hypothetical protein